MIQNEEVKTKERQELAKNDLSTQIHPDIDPKYIFQPPKKPADYYEQLGGRIMNQHPRINFPQASLIRK